MFVEILYTLIEDNRIQAHEFSLRMNAYTIIFIIITIIIIIIIEKEY